MCQCNCKYEHSWSGDCKLPKGHPLPCDMEEDEYETAMEKYAEERLRRMKED